jgi:hypothetical protein
MPQHPMRLYGLLQGYVFHFTVIYQAGLKLNGTHQLLAYADDMNLLGDNIDK